jgi:Ran GTPase-activating protein (RanGAP) involved in mRNA processing and transport
MKALEEVLTLSKTVKELNLSGNNVGDEGVAIIIKAMITKKKQSLNVLSLSDNKISSKGCKNICEFISKCACLQELQLSNNEIDNEGAKALIAVLKNKKQFNNIDIDNNHISGETLTDLFNMLPLRNLNLLKNNLNDE